MENSFLKTVISICQQFGTINNPTATNTIGWYLVVFCSPNYFVNKRKLKQQQQADSTKGKQKTKNREEINFLMCSLNPFRISNLFAVLQIHFN